MSFMVPHGAGIDFTWVLTVGVVVYAALSFAAYLLYIFVARRRRAGKRNERGSAS